MVNPDLDGLEGKWDKDESMSQDEQLKVPTDTRLYAVQVCLGSIACSFLRSLFLFLCACVCPLA